MDEWDRAPAGGFIGRVRDLRLATLRYGKKYNDIYEKWQLDLAKGRARTAGKLADLSMALEGRFTDHHALMCRLHLDRITALDAAVADLEARIAATAADWQREIDLLKTIPGFGDIVAWAWIAEIGPAPHQWFASHHKLASWVSLAPGNNVSAGKRKYGRTGDEIGRASCRERV